MFDNKLVVWNTFSLQVLRLDGSLIETLVDYEFLGSVSFIKEKAGGFSALSGDGGGVEHYPRD